MANRSSTTVFALLFPGCFSRSLLLFFFNVINDPQWTINWNSLRVHIPPLGLLPRTNPLWTVPWTMLAISLFFWPLPLMDNATNAGYTSLVLVSLDLPSTWIFLPTLALDYCPVIWMRIPS